MADRPFCVEPSSRNEQRPYLIRTRALSYQRILRRASNRPFQRAFPVKVR